MSDRLLQPDTIRHFLDEVADELPDDGITRTVIVVGGALLALLDFVMRRGTLTASNVWMMQPGPLLRGLPNVMTSPRDG